MFSIAQRPLDRVPPTFLKVAPEAHVPSEEHKWMMSPRLRANPAPAGVCGPDISPPESAGPREPAASGVTAGISCTVTIVDTLAPFPLAV